MVYRRILVEQCNDNQLIMEELEKTTVPIETLIVCNVPLSATYYLQVLFEQDNFWYDIKEQKQFENSSELVVDKQYIRFNA